MQPGKPIDVRDAARRGARYERTWSGSSALASEFPRLVAAVATLQAVTVEVAFSLDAGGHRRLHGSASYRADLNCQRCEEPQSRDIRTQLDCRLQVPGDPSLEDLDTDAIELEATKATLAELLEDDLLLALPAQVCTLDDCERMPPMQFPAVDAAAAAGRGAIGVETAAGAPPGALGARGGDRQFPFADLKQQLRDSAQAADAHPDRASDSEVSGRESDSEQESAP